MSGCRGGLVSETGCYVTLAPAHAFYRPSHMAFSQRIGRAMDGLERRWGGAALESGRQGTIVFFRSDADGCAGQPTSNILERCAGGALRRARSVRLHQRQPPLAGGAPDGKRFLLLTNAGKDQAPPLEVVVNWMEELLKK